jgi:serine protease Do
MRGVAIAAVLLMGCAAHSQDLANAAEQLNGLSRAVEALTERVSPSVVRITATRFGAENSDSGHTDVVLGKQQSIGSGVVIAPDGYILTNAHVVEGAQQIRVDLVSAGEQNVSEVLARARSLPVDAGIVGVFKEGDLALIKVAKTGLPALKFADYDKLRQGQVVFAFGSPQGLQNSVSMGVVSSIARQPNIDSPFLYIQTDTPINPGNSGGPLVNAAGEIVGLNTFILTSSGGSEGVGFAIPSPLLEWVSASMRKYGHVHRSSVGIGVQTITPVLARALSLRRDAGVVISDVVPGGPAEKAGMKLNDILLAVDGRRIDSVPAMMGFFFQHGGGEHVRFDVLRGDEKLNFDVVTLEQTDDADRLADMADPVKGLVAQLGVLGITVDQQIEEIMGPMRLPTGIAVVARVESSGMNWGLQVGDVIHAVNGNFVYKVEDLKAALAKLAAGNPVALLVERRGTLQYLSFEL